MVHLQRQGRARLHGDALHLMPITVFDGFVAAPRPIHALMDLMFRALRQLQRVDDTFDVLGAIATGDEYCIGGFDHHEVVHADRGQQPPVGDQQRACGINGHDVAAHVVVVRIP